MGSLPVWVKNKIGKSKHRNRMTAVQGKRNRHSIPTFLWIAKCKCHVCKQPISFFPPVRLCIYIVECIQLSNGNTQRREKFPGVSHPYSIPRFWTCWKSQGTRAEMARGRRLGTAPTIMIHYVNSSTCLCSAVCVSWNTYEAAEGKWCGRNQREKMPCALRRSWAKNTRRGVAGRNEDGNMYVGSSSSSSTDPEILLFSCTARRYYRMGSAGTVPSWRDCKWNKYNRRINTTLQSSPPTLVSIILFVFFLFVLFFQQIKIRNPISLIMLSDRDLTRTIHSIVWMYGEFSRFISGIH